MALFHLNEYLSRLERTKDRMEKAGLEVLIVTDPANMNYLTGYDAFSFYVDQAVVIALEEPEPLWVGRKMDVACARHTTWLAPESLFGWPEDRVQSRIHHPFEFVVELLKERGLAEKSIGLEMDSRYFTPRAYEVLLSGLPQARFEDSRLLIPWIRGVKSSAEIELMRKAGKVLEKVMQTAVEKIDVGVRECDVAAELLRAQAAGVDDTEGAFPAIPPIFAAGEKASAPHLTWTAARFENHQAVNLEFGACVKRYHAVQSRTLYLGKNPPGKLSETAKWTIDGLEAQLAAIRPGATCEAVHQEWRKAIAHTGMVKESRTGYAIGLGYPPDWGEQTACMRLGDRTVLQPGMTFHVMIGIWMDDWGFAASESVVVTDSGCEVLTHFPRQLICKG